MKSGTRSYVRSNSSKNWNLKVGNNVIKPSGGAHITWIRVWVDQSHSCSAFAA